MDEIKTIITLESAKISCNFDQVENAIQDTLSEYKGAVFTEDSKTYAKKVVASLRTQKKTLQDNLRDAKKKYMLPWDEFEARAKKLISMYDEPIDLINGQVKAFEDKRIAEKKQLIEQIYMESVSDEVKEYLPLMRIYNSKWENATVKEKDIRKEMQEVSESTKNAVNTIQSMNSEAVSKALEMYKCNLSLSDAITYINQYEQQKQEILAREMEKQRREEEERIRREERERILAEQRAKEALKQAEIEKAAAVEQAKAEGMQEAIDSLIPDVSVETAPYNYRISLSVDAKMMTVKWHPQR